MKQAILKYLKGYSFDAFKIDRLIVSAYLYSKDLKVKNNILLKSYYITEIDPDFDDLCKFLKLTQFENFEQLIEAFEFVVSPKDKVITGAVYSPKYIRDFIIEEMFSSTLIVGNKKICDPACGCAGFLYLAAKKIKDSSSLTYKEIFETQIYGLDIQQYSIKRSELLLTLFAFTEGEDFSACDFNLHIGNALNFDWGTVYPDFSGFDGIVGNPPYVSSRNVDAQTKEYLKNWKVCKTGRPDLYIPFFEIGYTILKENGFLGYITMNSFFKSLNGRALRAFFEVENCSLNIYDFGCYPVFEGKHTYTCVCLFEKKKSNHIGYAKIKAYPKLITNSIQLNKIPFDKLNSKSGWNLQDNTKILKIESVGTPLSKRFQSKNGIATLKNDVFVFDPINEDANYYYIKKLEKEYKIEIKVCRDIVNPNLIIGKPDLDEIKRKIIFPYFHNNLGVELIEENFFKREYPETYSYLLSQKETLARRDKGKRVYSKWYAFGRAQSLGKYKYKLFIPHLINKKPVSIFNDDENLLFVNGLAFLGNNKRELLLLQKILASDIFWYYIIKTSKNYNSGYFSISKAYFKDFGVFDFSEKDIDFILKENNPKILNKFINSKYEVKL
jgi:adenine-specific DNA-methyltransferase